MATTVMLTSYKDLAAEIGVRRETISDVVRRLGITPKPTYGRAKGLDDRDVKRIKKVLLFQPTN